MIGRVLLAVSRFVFGAAIVGTGIAIVAQRIPVGIDHLYGIAGGVLIIVGYHISWGKS